jgi:WD40 repeat protein
VQLAWGKARRNVEDLPFQMHGRLLARRSEMTEIDKYVASVEVYAVRPWIYSIDPFLAPPGGPLVVSPSVGFSVWCVIVLVGCGHVIIAGEGGNIVVVETATRIVVLSFQGHEGWVRSVAVSADGSRLASGGDDGTVRVWDAVSGVAVGEPLRGHEGGVRSVALNADGSRVVSGGLDATVRVWDVASGVEVWEPLRGHDKGVYLVAVSEDGANIFSGSFGGTALVWNTTGGTVVSDQLRGNGGGVWSVVLRAGYLQVFLSDDEGIVWVWDVPEFETVDASLGGSRSGMRTVAFGGDGSRIVLGDDEFTVYYSPADEKMWAATAALLQGMTAG